MPKDASCMTSIPLEATSILGDSAHYIFLRRVLGKRRGGNYKTLRCMSAGTHPTTFKSKELRFSNKRGGISPSMSASGAPPTLSNSSKVSRTLICRNRETYDFTFRIVVIWNLFLPVFWYHHANPFIVISECNLMICDEVFFKKIPRWIFALGARTLQADSRRVNYLLSLPSFHFSEVGQVSHLRVLF